MRLQGKDLIQTGLNLSGMPLAGGENWIAKVNEIISGINQLFTQYRQLQQNLPGALQRPQLGQDMTRAAPGGDPNIKILQAARLFLFNMQKSGMGDQPLGQVISQMPETVNQLAALLDQLIARSGGAKGIKSD